MVLRYQVNLPVMGVMFSPHYGQSYFSSLIDLSLEVSTLNFVLLVSSGHVEVGLRCEQWNVLHIFVCQRDRRAEINAT